MTVDKAVMMMAGTLNLAGLALAAFVDAQFLWLCAFVGIMLVQAPVTGLCPAAVIFRKLGVKPGAAFFESKGACCCTKEP